MHKSSFIELSHNIKLKLQKFAIFKKMDISKNLKTYLKSNPWLEFKYAFIDCGSSDILESSVKNLWPRIVKGGV